MVLVRQLDLVLLGLALPVFLVGGLPLLGWVTATVAWLAQRGLQHLATRRAAASDDPRTVVGLMAGSMIGRGWLVAGIIFAVGVNHNSAGLASALLVIALFTTYFVMNMIFRPFAPAAEPHR
jgi:hypothetical protein